MGIGRTNEQVQVNGVSLITMQANRNSAENRMWQCSVSEQGMTL
jgi:hypothetical protein